MNKYSSTVPSFYQDHTLDPTKDYPPPRESMLMRMLPPIGEAPLAEWVTIQQPYPDAKRLEAHSVHAPVITMQEALAQINTTVFVRICNQFITELLIHAEESEHLVPDRISNHQISITGSYQVWRMHNTVDGKSAERPNVVYVPDLRLGDRVVIMPTLVPGTHTTANVQWSCKQPHLAGEGKNRKLVLTPSIHMTFPDGIKIYKARQ